MRLICNSLKIYPLITFAPDFHICWEQVQPLRRCSKKSAQVSVSPVNSKTVHSRGGSSMEPQGLRTLTPQSTASVLLVVTCWSQKGCSPLAISSSFQVGRKSAYLGRFLLKGFPPSSPQWPPPPSSWPDTGFPLVPSPSWLGLCPWTGCLSSWYRSSSFCHLAE